MSTPPSPVDYGQSLHGFGVNLLVKDMPRAIHFLRDILGATILIGDSNFAAIKLAGHDMMLHRDETYANNPLSGFLANHAARGVGVELRLYHTDPDATEARARAAQFTILSACLNKPPHGLRECTILDDEGYAWVISRVLQSDEF